ncbi:MAG: hypothetical protein ABF791_09815 [Acetobacter sp.]|uniref:hypothetical protein n=1 Tax=Acetobacter sp. TaxID=440 RepID=UPI0039E80372
MGTSQKSAMTGHTLSPGAEKMSRPIVGDEKNKDGNRFFLPQAGLGMTAPPPVDDLPPLLRRLSACGPGPRTSLFRK